MRKRRWIILGTALVATVVLVFGVGGGFGPKANNALVNELPLAHFAHRGSYAIFPENCMGGIAHAIASGYDGVELDVRVTKDQVFVLFHDDSCARLLGLDGLLADHPLAALQARPLIRNHVISEERVPVLDEVLRTFGDSTLFYLDMKVSGLDHADRLAAMIAAAGLERRVLVASSSIPFITYLEFHHPEIQTLLEGFDRGEEWTWWLFPKHFRPDFLSSFASEVDDGHLDWLRAQDLLRNKFVYGMDSAAYARMRAAGLTRLIVQEGVPPIGR